MWIHLGVARQSHLYVVKRAEIGPSVQRILQQGWHIPSVVPLEAFALVDEDCCFLEGEELVVLALAVLHDAFVEL